MSRRDLGRRAALAAAAIAVPVVAGAQEADHSVAEAAKNLAKPLGDETRKLLAAALATSATNSANRLKFKLEDCSEPCTIFPVSPATRVRP